MTGREKYTPHSVGEPNSGEVAMEALGLYKFLKDKFGKSKFTLDDIDAVGGFKDFKTEHFSYLEETGVLENDQDNMDIYHLAKEMPEAA